MTEVKFWQAINDALGEEMERDPTRRPVRRGRRQPGGPYGVTRGLLDRFGAARVRDTPISRGRDHRPRVGAAMSGLRPVVEIMFFDFAMLAMDQIVNQAAKFRYCPGGSFACR